MEQVTCGLCGSINFNKVSKGMIACVSCTAQFPVISPASGIVTNQVAITPTGRGSFLSRRQAKLASRVCGGRSLIDFGCGNGAFLYAFARIHESSLSILGVELDEESSTAAKGAGLRIERTMPFGINASLVTMWHVAEHLTVEKQRDLFTILNSECNSLLISVPNGNSFSWRKHLERFSFFDKESHLMQHTPKSLNLLLKQCGWEVASEFRTPTYGLFNAIQTGLNLSLPHNELYFLMKRNEKSIPVRMIIRTTLAALRASFSIIVMMLFEISPRRCSSYTVHAIPVIPR